MRHEIGANIVASLAPWGTGNCCSAVSAVRGPPMSSDVPVIALLGFGEAGSAFGRDLLDRGVTVRVYDPKVVAEPPATVADSEADAVRGADLVLSVNSAHDAADALAAGLTGAGAQT